MLVPLGVILFVACLFLAVSVLLVNLTNTVRRSDSAVTHILECQHALLIRVLDAIETHDRWARGTTPDEEGEGDDVEGTLLGEQLMEIHQQLTREHEQLTRVAELKKLRELTEAQTCKKGTPCEWDTLRCLLGTQFPAPVTPTQPDQYHG